MNVFKSFVITVALIISANLYAKEVQIWSPAVFEYVKKTYGSAAEKRMRYLNKVVLKNLDKPDMQKLKVANDTFNNFPWIADKDLYRKSDEWASPMQMIASFGGDCEDIAIAKFTMLRHLGIRRDQMYLAYVKVKDTGEAHMVLLYKDNPGASLNKSKVYILDNLHPIVEIASKRKNLKGVYVLDADGKIYLIRDDGTKRSVRGVLASGKLKNFKLMQKKYLEDQAIFKKLNNGKYLFDYGEK